MNGLGNVFDFLKDKKPMKPDDTRAFSRLALYQESLPDNIVHCLLCPHQCLLKEGKIGLCRVRINLRGKLFTLAYGNLCSLAVDPIEKKPLFHFYPGTKIFSLALAGCNFRCLNCQNWEISQRSPQETCRYELMPDEAIEQALLRKTDSIAFTYTEPTVFFEYLLDTAKAAHARGLKTVLISNGYINEKPLMELCPYLDAANIDLKCFDEEVYGRLTGGRLQPVLGTLKTLRDRGVWLEITNLVIPGYTNNPEMIGQMCHWLVENGFADVPLHFSRFFPAHKLMDVSPTSGQCLLQAKKTAEMAGMQYVYIGNNPALNGENTYCPRCRHLVVERSGYTVRWNQARHGECGYCGEEIPGVWS